MWRGAEQAMRRVSLRPAWGKRAPVSEILVGGRGAGAWPLRSMRTTRRPPPPQPGPDDARPRGQSGWREISRRPLSRAMPGVQDRAS
eukprot:8122981-Pyramimonas_sp.AAC.1